MRKIIIAGNWKMNKTSSEAVELVKSLIEKIGRLDHPLIVICPPFTALSEVSRLMGGSRLLLGAQNMYNREAGAYTGEIAPAMLLTLGVRYVILGHSERREYFSETDDIVNDKVKLALKTGLIPIVCVGERPEERDEGLTEEVVGRQVDGTLKELTAEEIGGIAVAYEPVWAIGTGKTATPEMAQAVHAFIRRRLSQKVGSGAEAISILYGGSVRGENAEGLLNQPDIDGALVGGASLKVDEFVRIVRLA
jgi:triosephosphate isomerase